MSDHQWPELFVDAEWKGETFSSQLVNECYCELQDMCVIPGCVSPGCHMPNSEDDVTDSMQTRVVYIPGTLDLA